MAQVDAILEGNRLALARLLTQIENRDPAGQVAMNRLFPYTGKAHLIGVTGAPGTGKSTLVNQLARHYRRLVPPEGQPRRVAVVAVDPSSPFTGGALLGDRVRMRDLAGDPGVFIRSMASRGSLGGLSGSTAGVVQVLDAAGYEIILIETVGAGQTEVDIARLAHTTLVIEAPGSGDDIQAIKAGILEIADIIVINKADRPGVQATERALRNNLLLGHPVMRKYPHHQVVIAEPAPAPAEGVNGLWIPPILKVIATEGSGIVELAAAIERHHQYLVSGWEWQRREEERLQSEFDNLLQENLVESWRSRITDGLYQQALRRVVARDLSPWQAVQLLLEGTPP
jgi:LAO/AO transport system kinase